MSKREIVRKLYQRQIKARKEYNSWFEASLIDDEIEAIKNDYTAEINHAYKKAAKKLGMPEDDVWKLYPPKY